MSVVKIVFAQDYTEDRLAVLWNLMRLVREMPDTPAIWKLTDPFLEAIMEFLSIGDRDEVLCTRFLDTPVDATSNTSCLIGCNCHYPVQLVGYTD